MTDDDIFTALNILMGIFLLLAAPIIYLHVQEHKDDPLPPHSGFYPECPEWTAPISAPAEKLNVEY